MYIWGPAKSQGLTALKLWLAGWLQLYDVNAAITAGTATPYSNKVRALLRNVVECLPGTRWLLAKEPSQQLVPCGCGSESVMHGVIDAAQAWS